ncbi:MAG TPA: TonB-dependent receptor plug domain-containing protein [bacterium]|nr:TonB-dependent receptor plug domain-containing protein [bacterium]
MLLFILSWNFLSPAGAFLLTGQILEKGTKNPIPTASLSLEALGNTLESQASAPMDNSKMGSAQPSPAPSPVPPAFSTDADLKGRYRISLPPGLYRLTVVALGFQKTGIESITINRGLNKDFYLEKSGFTLPEVVVTTEKVSKPAVSEETLSKEELSNVPGTAGDVMRALQALPGVNIAGDFLAAPSIRGAGPLDNLFLMDRIPVIYPFHFGGLLSTLNSDMIQSVDFSTGGFGPQYGNDYGGLIDITQREGRTDRWGGRVEVTPILSEAAVEGPVTSDSSLSLSARRSYLEVLSGFLTEFSTIPAFDDYQAKLSIDPSRQTHWDFQAFGSEDNLGLALQSGFSLTPNQPGNGQFNYHDGFDSQGINFRHVLGEGDSLWATAYHTTFSTGVNLQDGYYFNLQSQEFGGRFDWFHDFDPEDQLRVGVEAAHVLMASSFFASLLEGQDDLDPFVFIDTPIERAAFTAASDNYSLYADQEFKSADQRFEFSVGGRWDYESYNHKADPSPRFSASYRLSGDTVFKASYGFYTQLPFQGLYSAPGFGNPQLSSELASSAVLGWDQRLGDGLSLRLEGYNKDLSRIVELDPDTNYNNQGSGYSRGVELFLRRSPSERFFGWVSYAFSDSQRRNAPGEPLYPYIYDQPQVATVVARYKLTPGWDVGFKWRYSTGLPYTPVVGAVYANSQNVYDPIYGPENSKRFPDYMRLDLSTSLTTVYDTWQWRVYLEIWNATNNNNVLTYGYSADFSQTQPIGEFPFLPYLGIEASY